MPYILISLYGVTCPCQAFEFVSGNKLWADEIDLTGNIKFI